MSRIVALEELFKGRHFDQEIVVLCVRWYLSFKLSYRDLVSMMSERGICLAHTTILRWVQHYTPEFVKRWPRYARAIGGSWRMDETYVKVRGAWMYLYRAVDKDGKTVDFFLSRSRDVNAAKAFLRKAMKAQRTPTKIIGGIELAEKIKKQQFKIGSLGGSKATMPELWQAALAA
jgi:transposase-like protein